MMINNANNEQKWATGDTDVNLTRIKLKYYVLTLNTAHSCKTKLRESIPQRICVLTGTHSRS